MRDLYQNSDAKLSVATAAEVLNAIDSFKINKFPLALAEKSNPIVLDRANDSACRRVMPVISLARCNNMLYALDGIDAVSAYRGSDAASKTDVVIQTVNMSPSSVMRYLYAPNQFETTAQVIALLSHTELLSAPPLHRAMQSESERRLTAGSVLLSAAGIEHGFSHKSVDRLLEANSERLPGVCERAVQVLGTIGEALGQCSYDARKAARVPHYLSALAALMMREDVAGDDIAALTTWLFERGCRDAVYKRTVSCPQPGYDLKRRTRVLYWFVRSRVWTIDNHKLNTFTHYYEHNGTFTAKSGAETIILTAEPLSTTERKILAGCTNTPAYFEALRDFKNGIKEYGVAL